MTPSDDAKFNRVLNACEAHEVGEVSAAGTSGMQVVDTGEPFMLRRQVGEPKKLGAREESVVLLAHDLRRGQRVRR